MAMQNNTKQSLAQRWNDYQPTKSILLWACAVTAILTMIVGFNWGGWVTGGTSQTMAATAGNVARGALASDICVEKFKAGRMRPHAWSSSRRSPTATRSGSSSRPAAGRPCLDRPHPTGSAPKPAP